MNKIQYLTTFDDLSEAEYFVYINNKHYLNNTHWIESIGFNEDVIKHNIFYT